MLKLLAREIATLRYLNNLPPNGFGYAVRAGLAAFRGDAVAIMMADGSDSPDDLVAFHRKLQEGYECVFGSRFIRGARVVDYPWPKLTLNRIANFFIRVLFWTRYNDMTNAFKLYRRPVIAGLQPLLLSFQSDRRTSIEAIVRGYSYAVIPTAWFNRTAGVSKFESRDGVALSLHRVMLS